MKNKKRPGRARRLTDKQIRARQMDSVAIGWMVNYANHHWWRLKDQGSFGFDDLIQEGHWCWHYVLHKYPQAKDPPHLMALFKLAFHCHITNLANRRTKDQTILSFFEVEPNDRAPEGATLHTLLQNAPSHIRKVLEIYTSPSGRKALQKDYRRAPNGKRETTNERLRKLTGIKQLPSSKPLTDTALAFWSDFFEPADLSGELREYFSPA